MVDDMQGKTVAFLVAPEGVEQVELTEPWRAVESIGVTPCLVSTQAGSVQAYRHLDRADTFPVEMTVDDVVADRFDALVLPGGVANPDYLRTIPGAVGFTRRFFELGKPVAVICHGPWTLVEAGVVDGRSLTSWPSLRTDISNAGGHWTDKAVVTCTRGPNTLISSRMPDDLPEFCATLRAELRGAE
ncbi:type 1 glutamine amidotransferase [Tsukamurella sp. 8F]|uniref:type 1 glutamine amidotransferase domain-containing protein n=1 Tax=unclassified Tsukamurella TaxID=2633480 RepID=UPI0023B9339B|nr:MULTISPECIES: type 1 glutamine amidotransferase domain-containing protein [unclassified Tsukamurella]MDF0532354.1 type 1 glutamine amidotransferase [Tsukamurella sp. 8J]MDF0588822.1 type 1 glutamine amidotransferase [Tsukamurella sp. 8F]